MLENQLVQAQKMDAIGKLTGGIAHDFNNLLAAVLGGIGLIERRAELAEEHRKILAMTKRAADQGTELVGRLLAFARRQQLQPAPIDISSLHRGVHDLLSHTLGGLVELKWNLPTDEWCAFADQSQLELALMNLIINARDAMPSGGTITISAATREVGENNENGLLPGTYVIAEVRDEGTGIAQEILQKVLEPFFTTKPVGKGTGLGLSMVYGFARQSGGTLQLSSEVGCGTRATIWLPRSTAEVLSANYTASSSAHIETPPKTILLVDDHAEVRATTAAILRDLGHSVFETASGADALELLKSQEVELLISDYAMPQLRGTEIVAAARELQPKLPALIITGYAEADEIGERPHDVAVLGKPFTVPELVAAINDTLKLSCAKAA
jgi:CheY-like chemotaxis protein/two-component sensor histidine kinase